KANSNKNNGVSIKNLTKKLELSNEQIMKSIDKLKSLYSINDKDTNNIYFANSHIDRSFPLEFDSGLNHINSDAYYYENIDSTNSFFKILMIKDNIKHGSVIVTEHQTKGRGQKNRLWEDKPFLSLLLSVFLKLNMNISNLLLLSPTIGLAVSETIVKHCSLDTEIKWPNDIYVSGRKCAGILVESSVLQSNIENAIIGIGINANYQEDDLPQNIKNLATSLRIETGIINNRMKILNELLVHLDNYLTMLFEGRNEEIANKVSKILHHRGNVVIYKDTRYMIDSINTKGELVLINMSNNEEKIAISSAGDLEYAYGN
ncbi:MAG: biotin--[acetyl-CoA-carboxylase] ligase, partial [Spirochaetota bacterium]